MKALHKIMVGFRPAPSVMCLPQCAIRHGDCLLPPFYSLCASMFIYQVGFVGVLSDVPAYMYVDDPMLVLPTHHEYETRAESVARPGGFLGSGGPDGEP